MPELPEVETIVRQLQGKVAGKTIASIVVHDSKVADRNLSRASNLQITSLYRRAKYIVFNLNNKSSLVAHLRMTGYFQFSDVTSNPGDYCAAQLKFSDGSCLTFHDIRRFAEFSYLSPPELEARFSSLGPEPLDKQFTLQQFRTILAKVPRSVIKSKLLDQSFIAGIGNIYAQEALYHAGILPTTPIKDISRKQQEKLYTEIRRILALAVEKNGTTVNNYAHLDGKGKFQGFLAVYQQTHCPQKHPLQFLRLGGRGTYYCSTCQK